MLISHICAGRVSPWLVRGRLQRNGFRGRLFRWPGAYRVRATLLRLEQPRLLRQRPSLEVSWRFLVTDSLILEEYGPEIKTLLDDQDFQVVGWSPKGGWLYECGAYERKRLWKSHDLDVMTKTLQSLHNYCRNPDDDRRGPWCFTDPRIDQMEYCDIPRCGQCLDRVWPKINNQAVFAWFLIRKTGNRLTNQLPTYLPTYLPS